MQNFDHKCTKLRIWVSILRARSKIILSTLLVGLLLLPEVPLGLMGGAAGPEARDMRIGGVTRIRASVSGQLDGERRKLERNLPVFQEEEIITGTDARAVLRFRDGSVLRIGANAKVDLDHFVYKGTGGVITLLKGAIRFTSGKMGRPGLRFKSPVATIGIRGTDFWLGEKDDGYGVLLLQGAITVSNNAGYVVLDSPAEGTFIASASSAPTPPEKWPDGEQKTALGGVTITPGPLCAILHRLGRWGFDSCS